MRAPVGYQENEIEDQVKNLFKLKMLKDLGGTRPEPQPVLDNLPGISNAPLNPAPVQPETPGQINMDVRANQELPETNPFVSGVAPKGATVGSQGPSQDPGFFQKLANGFKNIKPQPMLGATPQPEKPLQPNVESIPVHQESSFLDKLSNGIRNLQPQPMLGATAPAVPKIQPEAPQQPASTPTPQNQEPGTFTQPGASNQVLADPDLKSAIEERFGLKVTPEMQAMINDYEVAAQSYKQKLDEFDATLTSQQQEIKQRLANRDLSTQDKILMGIALAAPALAFAIAGDGQAALGALGGGIGGVATALSDRETNRKEDQALLADLGLTKAKAGKEGLENAQNAQEFAQKVKESHPNAKVRRLFEENGNILNGKLVLETGNDLLPLKADYVQTPEDLKRFKEKRMPELEDRIAVNKQSDTNLDNMVKLIEEAKKQNSSGGFIDSALYDAGKQAYQKYVPSSRDTFKDENGVEHNISALYNTYRTQQSDLYRKENVKGANFSAAEKHFLTQLPDIFSQSAIDAGPQRFDDAIASIEAIRNKSNQGLLELAEASGVDTSRLKQGIKQSPSSTKKDQSQKDKARAEAAAQQVINSRAK